MPRLVALLLFLLATPLAAQPVDSLGREDSLATEEVEAFIAYPRTRWTRSVGKNLGLEVLPVRSVRRAAALLPRVRGDFHSDRLVVGAHPGALNPRGDWYPYAERVGQEPVFIVDGVRVADRYGVPFEAVASVEALTGFVPARYGEAAGGLVLVETREGEKAVGGELEVGTSEVLDAYGHTRAAFSLGGPLGRGQFSLSGSWQRLADASLYGIETYRLSDVDFDALQQNPQVLRLIDGSGNREYLPLPSDLIPATGIGLDAIAAQLGDEIPVGFQIDESLPVVNAPETYTADQFDLGRGMDDPLRDLRLYGTVTLRARRADELQFGGGLQRERADHTAAPAERWASEFYNRDRLDQAEYDAYSVWGRLRQTLTPTMFYELRLESQAWSFVSFPGAFSSDVADALFYGDIDAESATTARRYTTYLDGVLQPLYTVDSGVRPGRVGGLTFFLPGRTPDRYRKREGAAVRVTAHAETQIGIHRVAFGGEFEQQQHRAFEIAGASLASFYADGSVESFVEGVPDEGVRSYADLPFEAVRPITIVRYGYDALGLDGVEDQDIDAYFSRTDTDIAPYRPIYYAGYLQDRLNWRSLSLDLGLRVSAFDANTDVLLDPYATTPILRARDVTEAGANIGSDWAVYFGDGGQVVGYRDLDGTFYGTGGDETDLEVIQQSGGRVRAVEGASRSEAFEASPVHVVLQPRIGASLDATEGVRVFAHYTRQARRPPPELYAPFTVYEGFISQSPVGNARLRPELLDAFGIGSAFAVRDGLGVTASLFYDRHRDLPVVRTLSGGFPSYTTIVSEGSLTTYGLSTSVRLERSHGIAVQGSYTFSRASGTDSDATSTSTVTSPGGVLSDLTSAADFDVRHAVRAVLDYRVPEHSGSGWLGGFGAGLTASAQSGRPYTALAAPGFEVGSAFTAPIAGGVNGARRPWRTRLDVWIDKRFMLREAQVTAFFWVENVLGAETILALYRATREATTDGFLGTGSGADYLEQAPVPESRTFNYASYVGGPANVGGRQSTDGRWTYGRPRQIRFGFRVGF